MHVAVKQGAPRILRAWGLGAALVGGATLRLSSKKATIGQHIGINLQITSTARKPKNVVIDYAIHFTKANGARAPKVFKGWKATVNAGESLTYAKNHSLRVVTPRKLYLGTHAVEILINGKSMAIKSFELG
jgi:hypothetical protein